MKISKLALTRIMILNRFRLMFNKNWLTHKEYTHSYYGYGIPATHFHLVKSNYSRQATYTDLLQLIAHGLESKICYLELGVSFGKNFLLMDKNLKHSRITGVDLENPSNKLIKSLKLRKIRSWKSLATSVRSEKCAYYSAETKNKNQVRYVAGDINQDETWLNLGTGTYNLIFSDAQHHPRAIKMEINNLLEYEKLNEQEFIIVWDDAWPHMYEQILKSWNQLIKQLGNMPNQLQLIQLYGWLGKRDYGHPIAIGVFGNFKLIDKVNYAIQLTDSHEN